MKTHKNAWEFTPASTGFCLAFVVAQTQDGGEERHHMPAIKSPTIKKVFDDFEAKLKADEKVDDVAAERLMTLLNGDQVVTAQRVRESLFPPSQEGGDDQ